MALTVLKVRNAGPGKYTDTRGLCLVVRPTGGKFWTLRIQHKGRRRELGLGSVLDLGLEEARLKAAQMRLRIKQGFDPIAERQAQAEEQSSWTRRVPSFEKAARECYEALKAGWDDRRQANWISSLEQHVFPLMGKRPVDKIDSAAVRTALAPIWLKIPDTARRILQRINAVLDFAHIQGWRLEETSLRGVRKALPRQSDRKSHYEAMPFEDTAVFMRELRSEVATNGRDALRFLIYTAARSGEVRNAVWSEIDLEKATWSLPASRMKARQPHVVPLPVSAVAILKRRRENRTSEEKNRAPEKQFIFMTPTGKALSDATLTKVLRDAGVSSATVHGFRSSFTDWAAEKTNFPKEVADKALAHVVPNLVEAAYRRTDFFDKRRQLMTQWAEFLDTKPRAEARPST